MASRPTEGAGWRTPFIGPWGAAATSIQSFDAMVCQPNPTAVAVGVWFGALHLLGALAKPVAWAPSLGEGGPGTPHGGRRGGRNRGEGKPKAKFKPVFNLPASSEIPLEGGLSMALFDLASVALEVGYVLFLADLFRDSLLVGMSAAYTYGGCVPSSWGPAVAIADHEPLAPGATARVFWLTQYDPSHAIAVNRWFVPAGISASFTYTVNVTQFLGPVGGVEAWIFDESAAVIVGGLGVNGHPDFLGNPYKTGNHGTLPVSSVGRTYSLMVRAVGGWIDVVGSTLQVGNAISLFGALLPDP